MPLWQVFFCPMTAVWSYMCFRNIRSIAAESYWWAGVLMRWECQTYNIWLISLSWMNHCHEGVIRGYLHLCSYESVCTQTYKEKPEKTILQSPPIWSCSLWKALLHFPNQFLNLPSEKSFSRSARGESPNLIITLPGKCLQRIHQVFSFLSYVSFTLVIAHVSYLIHSLSSQHLNPSHSCRLLSSLCVSFSRSLMYCCTSIINLKHLKCALKC